mmetsp:Transcript_77054/g.222872  ORF Transcript_77054/g.222872 Transcript_77054/m.222872 type:complete len:202 (-) Transcript_77054:1389-1994(-)
MQGRVDARHGGRRPRLALEGRHRRKVRGRVDEALSRGERIRRRGCDLMLALQVRPGHRRGLPCRAPPRRQARVHGHQLGALGEGGLRGRLQDVLLRGRARRGQGPRMSLGEQGPPLRGVREGGVRLPSHPELQPRRRWAGHEGLRRCHEEALPRLRRERPVGVGLPRGSPARRGDDLRVHAGRGRQHEVETQRLLLEPDDG